MLSTVCHTAVILELVHIELNSVCVRVCVCEPELPFGFAQLLNIFQWLVNGVHGVCNAFGFDSTEPVTHNSAALEKTKYLW